MDHELTPERLSLLREIAHSSAPYMLEDARTWGADAKAVSTKAADGETLAVSGLITAVGFHMPDDVPGAFTLYEATAAGREAARL